MGWSKATKPPSGISYFFVLVFVIVPVLSQIPPGSPVIDGPQVIVLNNQITLTCTSPRGDPPPTVKWFKDDTEITTGTSTTSAGTAVTTSLSFTATLDDHLEVYECQAENGVLQNPLTTTKYIEVHFSPLAPVLTGPTTLTPGQQGIWTCISANGYPAGIMSMRNQNKNTQFTTEFTSNSVLQDKSYDVTGTLTWSPVTVNNGDTICCDVTHTTTLGNTPQTVCRQITVAQPIAINAPVTSYTPTLQTTVTLLCDVTQGTASQIIWIKDNVQLNLNTNSRLTGGTVATESLTITNVQQSDGGNYVCRGIDAVTGNIVNTDTINVNPVGTPPVTSIPQPSYTQITGQQIILGCTVQSSNSPLQEVQWTFTNNQGQTTDPISVSTSNGKYSGSSINSPSLTINSVASTDQGTYSCKARNLVGTSTNNPTTTLTVTGSIPVVQINPTTYTSTYGSQVEITCNIVSASPAATQVYWQRSSNNQILRIDNGDQGYQGSTTSTPSLIINFATTSDAGVYTCFATNAVGTGSSNLGTVTITGGLLSVFVTPQNQNVVQGAQQRITCTVSGTPAAQNIAWLFTAAGSSQQTQLNTGNNQKYSLGTTQDPFLTVLNFQPSDAGTYVCRATNAAGSSSSNPGATLTYITVPTTNVEPRQFTATVGDASFQIQCQVTATPGATSWYWTFQPVGGSQQTIAQGTNDNQYTIDNSGTNPHLTIKSIALNEAGIYTCYATNAAGTSDSSNSPSSRHTLTVTGAILTVTISPATANVIRGNTQTIDCNPQGNPAATQITWYFTPSGSNSQQLLNIVNSGGKYNGGTPGNPDLTITDFQTNNAGSYRCAATNAAGTGTSSNSVLTYVEFLSLTVSPSSGSAVLGAQTYVIACQITGNPTATNWYWTKTPSSGGQSENINRNTNNNKYTVQENAQNPQLTIKNIQQSDDANYVCNAQNTAGLRTSSAARLIVTGQLASITASPSTQFANYGANSVTIQCSVSASPSATAVGWRKVSLNGQTSTEIDAQNSNNKYSIVNSLTAPHLTISNVDFNDDSNYVCFATNAVGTGTSNNARVDVIGSAPQVSIPQSAYSVIYGSDITIPCTILNANPAHFRVTWYYTGSNNQQTTINTGDPSQYSGGVLGNPGLTILNANNQDAGFYKCEAENQVNSGQSSNTQLNVIGDIPVVQLSKTTEVVVFDASVTLVCSIRSQNPVVTEIVWQFTNSNQITTQIVISTSAGKYSGSTVNNPSLTINNAVFQDAGTYQCFARNAVGTGQSSTLALGIAGGALTVTIPSSTYSVLLGNQISITCTVSGSPSATNVYWMKQQTNGGSFSNVDIAGNNRYSGGTLSSPTLVINSAQFSDEGNYRCHGVNAAGDANSIVTNLDVTGSAPVVNVASNAYSVNIGNSITLQCNVQANPFHTSVKWQRVDVNGNAVDIDMTNSRYTGSEVNSPSLVISQTMKSDEGRYVCLATNAVGTGQSQQTYLTVVGSTPTVTVDQPQYSANKGSDITLQCSYTANPAATMVRWERANGNTVVEIGDTTNNNKYGGSTVSSPSLIIYNAEESDEGNYKCKVTNSVGTGISTTTNLNVVGNIPIVTVPTSAYTVNVDGSITLACQVTADPTHTQVYWQKVTGGNTQTITINGGKYTGSSVTVPALTISNAQFADAGTYYCFARNSVGTGSSTQVVLAVSGNTPSVSLTQNAMTVNYGNNVTIGCVVSANPSHTSVYWQKISGGNTVTIDMSNTNKYGGGTVASPSLYIIRADTSDAANYVCFAANSVGTGQSSQGTLTVAGSVPVVTIPQNQYTINVGTDMTIPCNIQSNPQHTQVYWTKKVGNSAAQNIPQGTSDYGGGNVNSPSLIIYNVEEADEAQYNCFAVNIVGTGSASSPTFLNVIGNPPVVTASIPNSVRLGDPVTITCVVTANPGATQIRWKFITNNAESVIDINNNNRYTGGTVQTPSLTISPVEEVDRGSYKCEATNAEGTASSSPVFLNTVGDRPTNLAINPSPITVEEGEVITATCSATGNPNPTFEWRKLGSDNVISNSPVLTINNAQESHKGTYICKAINTMGSGEVQTTVTVHYKPKVTITTTPVQGKKGQSVEIPCEFTSNPFATSVTWTKIVGGQSIQLNLNGNKYQGATVTHPSLTILDLQASDIADYRCSVLNIVGVGNSNIGRVDVDLTVAPFGIMITPNGITVLEGNAFSMFCNATANPSPQYEWYHKDTKVGDGQTYTVQNSIWTPHDGLYTCKAYNSAGEQQATIDVDVKYIPVSAVTTNSFSIGLNSPITLSCDTLANPSAISWQWKYNGFILDGQTEKLYTVDMNSELDYGQYTCIAYNEVGHSVDIHFSVTVGSGGTTPGTGASVPPGTGASVASAGLTGGEIAAICLGILFFILLLIVLCVCCILQGCCAMCFGAGAGKDKERRITPDHEKLDIPRFYEVPTVVTREPSMISKRDVYVDTVPMAYGAARPQNDYEITKYRVVRPEYDVGERYVTHSAASRPYYLPAIEYTYDEEERRRRRRKKKKSRHHQDELRGDEQIVLEERVVSNGGGDIYRTTSSRTGNDVEVIAGPEYYFEAE